MPTPRPAHPRLEEVRELIREKGLSRTDLELLDEMLRLGATDLSPLVDPAPGVVGQEPESPVLLRLRRSFGLLLLFLDQIPSRKFGEIKETIGLVLQHSLAQIAHQAQLAHRDILSRHEEPLWVQHLLELIAALRTMSSALGTEDQAPVQGNWHAFLQESREAFRELFQALGARPDGPVLVNRLNQQMKALNQSLSTQAGRPLEHIRKLENMLGSVIPEETRRRSEPLLLIQHVISSLRLSLVRPLDRGIHWPAIEHARGSLQWLWNHLGWALPRLEKHALEQSLPKDVWGLLRQLRQDKPDIFRIVARALSSHLALLGYVEHMEAAGSMPLRDRYAAVPLFFVVESELGRLADRVYHPREAEQLGTSDEDVLLLGAFLRQAVLSLLQDQTTIRNLLGQTLATNDVDQLVSTLDNLKALLLNHQRQLMADLVGLFSPELRQRLFPDSPSLTEEGDRLRQRLRRLWEYLDPAMQQIQLHLELQDLPRLALSLAHCQNQVAAFRRSPEFLLIRSQDRQEVDRLTQQFGRMLDNPGDIERALREGAELAGELLRFLDVFLLRINARVPLIRHDLTTAREALGLAHRLAGLPPTAPERNRLAHRLIQTTKPLGVRDPQALSLLKRWVRIERSTRDSVPSLEALGSHLDRLASRLDAALS